jgi:drug/metabolite transporter (DMT)-like permease
LNTLIVLAGCVLLSAAASISLKIGAATLAAPSTISTLVVNHMILIGGIFYSAAFLGYIYILRVAPLSLVQPVITAGVSVITALVAVMFLRESMSLVNWLGLTLICAGMFFLFWGRT